jgi:hypothetical protein
MIKPLSVGPWVASRSVDPFSPTRFPSRTRRASGCPHALLPARTPPPCSHPTRAEASRRATSPSCVVARPKDAVFLVLTCCGSVPIMLRGGTGYRQETSPPVRCGRAAIPLGQCVDHPRGAPKPSGVLGLHAGPHVVVATEDPGGSRAAGHPRPSHTRACTALSHRRPHPDLVRRPRHRHARLPHGLQSTYSRLCGSHLSTKSRPATI